MKKLLLHLSVLLLLGSQIHAASIEAEGRE